MITFQYNLTKKKHFKSLLKGQLKTISIFLFLFTFCYFAINLEAFLYNFPYNTPVVLITYFIYIVIIFIIMFLISLIYSLVITTIFKKNNAYRIYEYKIINNKLVEDKANFELDLEEIKNIKITKKIIKLFSFKLKQVITFEQSFFENKTDFNKLKDFFKKKKNNLEVV